MPVVSGSFLPAPLPGTAAFIRLCGSKPWRALREKLKLEGETRQFLAHPSSRIVVAVTCTSRLELFGAAVPDGEMRFRNPAAKAAGLAPAVLSSV